MAVHQEAQETDLPPHFGEWLAKSATSLSPGQDEAWQDFGATSRRAAAEQTQKAGSPIPPSEIVTQFEKDVIGCEELINIGLDGFVEFIRQAGLHDNVARKFDIWTMELDLAQTFALFEEQLAPHIKAQTALLLRFAGDWNRRAKAGEIKPELPSELVRRVSQLDARAKKLTRKITQCEDNELIARLLIRVGKHRPLNAAEKIRLSDAVRMKVKYKIEPSALREEWHGDHAS